LESKLLDFLTNIKETQSPSDGEMFIQQVENLMIKLHNRHDIEESSQHTVYRTRKEWMIEEDIESWTEILKSNIPIHCHIFGFNPVLELHLESDLELNHARCIPFGIIPPQLESTIKEMSKGVQKYYTDTDLCRCIQNGYETRWNATKDVLRARVMGLHSIIGTISSSLESEFEDKAKAITAVNTNNVHDKDHEIPTQPSILRKSCLSETVKNNKSHKRKRVRFKNDMNNPIRKKSCKGITCNKDFSEFHFVRKTANSIEFNKKHCQRCSRKHTAIGKCINILQDNKTGTDSAIASKITSIADKTSNDPQHKIFLQALRPLDQNHSNIPEQKRLTDSTKNIIQTMSSSISRSTDRDQPPTLRLGTALTHFKAINENINKFLKADLKRNIDLDRNMLSIASNIQKKIKTKSVNGTKEGITEKVWMSSQEQRDLKEDKLQTLERHKYMSNRTMNRAITNLRSKAHTDIYIGVTASAHMIDNLAHDAP